MGLIYSSVIEVTPETLLVPHDQYIGFGVSRASELSGAALSSGDM